jgi:hypothetical protein
VAYCSIWRSHSWDARRDDAVAGREAERRSVDRCVVVVAAAAVALLEVDSDSEVLLLNASAGPARGENLACWT